MPLSQLSLALSLGWQLSTTNAGFGSRSEGPDSLAFNLQGVDTLTWNNIYTKDYVVFVVQPSGLTATAVAGGQLTASTTYYYKITATGGTQETQGSNEASATPSGSNLSVHLTWTASQGATGYNVYRGTVSGSENTLIASIGANSNSFTDTGETSSSASPPGSNTAGVSVPTQSALATATTGGALAEAEYYYVVTATAGGGETTASNEKSVTVGTSGSSTVTISWGAVGGATGYKVYRGTQTNRENILIATLGAVTSFLDCGQISTAQSPPGAMPNNYVEFDLSSFTNLNGETVTPGNILGILLLPSGANAQCSLAPGQTNGLTWFFSGTTPAVAVPVTAASGKGGVFLLCGPTDGPGQTIDSTHKTLRVTNGGTGNLSFSIGAIVGPK